MALAEDRWKFASPSGIPGPPLTGPAIASAASISPTHLCHHITGTAAIGTIVVPYVGFSGFIILIPDGIFTWTAAANIAIAGTAVVNKALWLFYDAVVGKWVPSYIA